MHGLRTVTGTCGQLRLGITFIVCDVAVPILSVSKLLQANFNVALSKHASFIERNGHRVELALRGGLHYLPMQLHATPPEEQNFVAVSAKQSGVMWANADRWEVRAPTLLVRIHRRHRNSMFV